MERHIIIVRGGGDLATGTIQKLARAGFRVLVLERPDPLCIRRTVSAAEAISLGAARVEDINFVRVEDLDQIGKAWSQDEVPVLVDPLGTYIEKLRPLAVVDLSLAKKNLGMTRDLAPITIGVGPGFTAGQDVDLVIESQRGHDLGRLIFQETAAPNTGLPGLVGGYDRERLLRAPATGKVKLLEDIGSPVKEGQVLAYIGDLALVAKINGLLRGMVRDGAQVEKGQKIGDIDPRGQGIDYKTISDKARTIGGGVLEGILILGREKNLL